MLGVIQILVPILSMKMQPQGEANGQKRCYYNLLFSISIKFKNIILWGKHHTRSSTGILTSFKTFEDLSRTKTILLPSIKAHHFCFKITPILNILPSWICDQHLHLESRNSGTQMPFMSAYRSLKTLIYQNC